MRTFEPPKNESWEHFLLKQVAVAYLRLHCGCTIAAAEVTGICGNEYNLVTSGVENGKELRTIADAIGIRVKDQWLPKKDRIDPDVWYKRIETVYCIEVKVSRNDFFSGYCAGGDLNYVMTPKGLVGKQELHPRIGLIEVDMQELDFSHEGTNKRWELSGIQIIKRATGIGRKANEKIVDQVFRDIARRLTLDRIKNNPWFYPGWNGGIT